MSLKNRYKVSNDALETGVWFDFPNVKNEDGSIPGFKLANSGPLNRKWKKATEEWTNKHKTKGGLINLEDMSEEQATQYNLDVFVESVLMDWRNFYANDPIADESGALSAPDEYSRERAREIFKDTEWINFINELALKASDIDKYNYENTVARAKN